MRVRVRDAALCSVPLTAVIVDDHEGFRQVASAMLAAAGYPGRGRSS
jgi:hypothetical protein